MTETEFGQTSSLVYVDMYCKHIPPPPRFLSQQSDLRRRRPIPFLPEDVLENEDVIKKNWFRDYASSLRHMLTTVIIG